MADAQAIASALAQVMGPALAGLAPPAQVPAAPVMFSRTPAEARANLLDYTNAGDTKIYHKAIEGLPTTFSLAQPIVTILMSELETRARSSSWTALLTFIINGLNLSFLQHYGRVNLPDLKTHVNTFIDAGLRPAQNDYQLYLCLTNSVDGETKEVMQAERHTYMAGAGNNVESGLLYVKKLLMTAEVDTRATTSHARDNLGSLDTYMTGLNDSDVVAFNKYVRRQLQTLTARGETTNDLVNNLFKGYLCAKSKEFCEFIKQKRNSYREGEVNYTPESLMLAAENQYAALKLDGDWEVVSEEEHIITALRATIAEMASQRSPGNSKKTLKRDGKPESDRNPSDRFKGKMAWKSVAPKSGEPAIKNVGKNTYHWCPHHGFWTIHKPEDCTLATATEAPKSGASPQTPAKKKLTFAEAAAAILDDECEGDQE